MISLFRQKHNRREGAAAAEERLAPGVEGGAGADAATAPAQVGTGEDVSGSAVAATPVIGVIGAKGGVGATTIAINLAASMSFDGMSTTLIDTNLQQPDVALMLGRQPQYSLHDLIERRGRMDENILRACCEKINLSGGSAGATLSFISPPADLEKSLSTDLERLTECLPRIRALTESVVLDLPGILDRCLLSLLDSCDLVLLVVEPSIGAIAGGKRWLYVLEDLGFPKERIAIVINRAGGKFKHLDQEVVAAFGNATTFKLPNAYSVAESSLLSGEPIVSSHPKDAYSKAIAKLAAMVEKKIKQQGEASSV